MKRYIAKVYLVVGDNSYLPGNDVDESEELCLEFVFKNQVDVIEVDFETFEEEGVSTKTTKEKKGKKNTAGV